MAIDQTYIYSLDCPITGEPKYIGKANNLLNRYNGHMSELNRYNTPKTAWIQSLLKIDETPVINILDSVPLSEWKFWEQYYIDLFKSWGIKLKNSTNGGEGGSLKGRKLTDVHKKRIGLANKGKIPPKHVLDKARKAVIIYNKTKRIYKKGYKLSLDHINKISKGNTGKRVGVKLSKDHIAKLRESHIGKMMGEDHPMTRIVEQYDLNGNKLNEFWGYMEASRVLGLNRRCISNCANGKQRQTGGFLFKIKG